MKTSPGLERRSCDDIAWWTDPAIEGSGVVVAFSERTGGVSRAPYASLNLAAHVGDEPAAVDENRTLFLDALGLGEMRERLTMANQVHGARIATVGPETSGAGAFAQGTPDPLEATDGLVTATPGTPLLLCFADCVPIVLVAPGPTVAVLHAGWRGALARIASKGVAALLDIASCLPDEVTAYVGPHIGSCDYRVDERILSQFVNAFGTFARAESGGLDLGYAVATDLVRSGVPTCRIAVLGECTAERTERFFSYRAEHGSTGRHGALACILS